MGWAGGSGLFGAVIKAAKRFIKDDKDRRKFYLATLPAFNDDDWDTQGECEGLDPIFDRILREQGYINVDDNEDDVD
jgi:hypothetical protein